METLSRVRRLTCCCCGAGTEGRQWHNRDTGYGLCPKCYWWIKGRGKTEPDEMYRNYGAAGVHHSLDIA